SSAAPPAAVSATQGAYQAIRQMIITGELAPGEKLKIEHLKDRMNTGASPIREALTLLVSDQLVERLDQRGFRAAPVSQENFGEILKLRCALE
ncbi:GntR family transcriptional regulator, partial [Fluviibacterium sp. DFM31]